MTHLLPPNLLRHFTARPPIEYAHPLGRDPAVPLGLAGTKSADKKRFRGVFDVVSQLREQEALFTDPAPSSADPHPLASTNGAADEKAAVKAEEDVKPDAMAVDAKEEGEAGEVVDDPPKPASKPAIEPPSAADELKKVARAGLSGMAFMVVGATEEELEKLCKVQPGVPDERGVTLTSDDALKIRSAARKRRKELATKRQAETYDPNKDENATGDPYKTLFLSRLHPDVTEADLRKEFDMYGRIDKITLVRDKQGKSRKYAFILYERERDMKAAYKDAEGIKILGKRILVDVERGRTVKDFKPMRLGGGLGGRPKPVVPTFGGFRGGRGGFRGGPFRGGPPRGGYAGGSFNGPPRFNGPPGGGFGDRGGGGFGDRGGNFGGDRGGPPMGPPPGAHGNGPPQGGPPRFDGPRGGGIGFGSGPPAGGGGWGGGPPRNDGGGFNSGPPKRDHPSHGGGFDDRDSKRPRY